MSVSVAVTKRLPESWWLFLLQGIATLFLGLMLVIAPAMTTSVLVTFLGAYWLVGGIFAIVNIFVGERAVHWGWLLLSGVMGILAGIAILDHPLLSTILLPTLLIYFLAVDGLVIGAVAILQALRGAGWGAGIGGGINIIFGLLLLGSPLVAASVLPVAFGVFGIVGGLSLIVLALRLRNA